MATVGFDTPKFVETLLAAGLPDGQARAISQAVREAHDTAELASSRDLRDAGTALRGEMQSLGAALRTDLHALGAEVKSDMQALRAEAKSDMQALRAEVKSDMQTLRAEARSDMQALGAELRSEMQALRAEIRALEPRLTIRLGGIVVVALGAFTALSKWVA